MAKKKKTSKNSASTMGSFACYEEALAPPSFEDAPCPEPCEEVTRGPYDEDLPAACDKGPPPEALEQEVDIDTSQRGLAPKQERPIQPSNSDITEDEQEIKREPTLALTETSGEVLEQTWIS
jgi:hypothetical protein